MTVPSTSTEALPPRLRLAFAPLHKRAFGTAFGVVAGLGIFAITVFEVLRNPAELSPLHLLSQYFAGYEVSWPGAFIGLLWGAATGFVLGWFLAFSRNFFLAATIFWIRTRAQFRAHRDFLDHI